jgi:arylsulfatase A-like enzyme
LLTGAGEGPDAPVYFMSEDRVSLGLRRRNILTGAPVTPVEEPSCVEAVVGRVDGRLWKLTHYYEELTDWRAAHGLPTRPEVAADEWELHDLTGDPEERSNLVTSADHRDERETMQRLLEAERDRVRAVPTCRNREPAAVAGNA